MGPAFEQGVERQREFFEPVHAEAKALADRARSCRRATGQRMITLKLAREVAEANVGIRRMQAEADARAEEQIPKGLRGLIARLLRRRRATPDATPEAARAAERLYGRSQTEILAQQLGQRALSRQQRKTGRRFFRRHG